MSITLQSDLREVSVPIRAKKEVAGTLEDRTPSGKFLLLGGIWDTRCKIYQIYSDTGLKKNSRIPIASQKAAVAGRVKLANTCAATCFFEFAKTYL